jgi:hypothetical protein
MQERRSVERKKKFEIPDKIKFAQKINVKTLPPGKTQLPKSKPASLTLLPKNDLNSKTKSRSSSLTPTPKPPAPIKKPDKLSLKSMDIKIDLTHLKQKEALLKKFNENIGSLEKKDKAEFHAPKVTEIKQFRTEDLKTDSDYAKALSQLIELKGSFLSLKLCTDFIDEMKNTFDRPLVLGDLKMAADFFVKQEKAE